MRPTTKCREYMEGRIGRYRWYVCNECGDKFKVFTRQLVTERLCSECKGGQVCPKS